MTDTPELQPLKNAATELYMAGRWSCDREVDEAGLWQALRDALGLPEGTATAAGISECAQTPGGGGK